jgi:hypothetical protein
MPDRLPFERVDTVTTLSSPHDSTAPWGRGGMLSSRPAVALRIGAGSQPGSPGTFKHTARWNSHVPFGVEIPSWSQLGSQSVHRVMRCTCASSTSPGASPSRAIRQSFGPRVRPPRNDSPGSAVATSAAIAVAITNTFRCPLTPHLRNPFRDAADGDRDKIS